MVKTVSPKRAHSVDADATFDESPLMTATFTIAQLATLYNSGLGEGHSNDEQQAVAQALLRYNAHRDGTHYHTRVSGGLHPSYVGFNPAPLPEEKVLSKCKLVEASLGDVFDAVRWSKLPRTHN